MAYTKLTKDAARKAYGKGVQHTEMAVMDQDDATSRNLAVAMNNYAAATMSLGGSAIDGLNELLERVDRIEQLLKTSSSQLGRGVR